MKTITVLLALLFLSCSTLKTTRDVLDEEFDTYAQELRYERDVYKLALEECNQN